MRLLLDERILADGRIAQTWASRGPGDAIVVDHEGDARELPAVALERVMARFGKPLDDGIAADGDALALGDGRLRRLRFHAAVDATGRDYLVWERDGQEPLAVLATTATAAVLHLLRSRASEN